MKRYFIPTLLILWTTFSFGQLVQRKTNETIQQFAERLKPKNTTLTHKVVETKWNDAVPAIIAFYDHIYTPNKNNPDRNQYHKITGAVFITVDKDHYRKTTFGTLYNEGDRPHVEAVFFANADKDKERELIVIASWQQRHRDVYGTLYGTSVFDYDLKNAPSEWKHLEDISQKVDGGCECDWSDGTSKKAKFKTAAAIKKGLIRLGYNQ